MSDLQEIKKRIYDEGRIEELLEKMGCQMIDTESGGSRYVAQLPPEFNSSNRRSVQVYNTESLVSAIRTLGIRGDIYTITSIIVNKCKNEEQAQNDLPHAKRWICEQLGYYDMLRGTDKKKKIS